MITEREFIMIHELKKQGYSIRAIARITGKDRKTVTRHLKATELLSIKRSNHKPSKLTEFKAYVLERISKTNARIPSGVILKELRSAGYRGSLRTLQEFLKVEYAKRVKVEPVVRFETAPGYQAQVDWTTIRTGKDPIYAFVMTMGYSRSSFVCFTDNMESSTLIDCHHKAFAYFGGIPKTILFDNMKTVVDIRDAYGDGNHRFNEAFNQFAKDCGFVIKLCKPYRAKTKGKVERFNHYLKSNFYRPLAAKLSGGIIKITVELLNSYVTGWLNEANSRIHGTTNKKPIEMLNDEVAYFIHYSGLVTTPKEVVQPLAQISLKLLPPIALLPIEQPALTHYDKLVV